LGVLTRRANQYGAAIGMLCGFGIELYLWRATKLPWTWWVMIGASVTFGVGWFASGIVGGGVVPQKTEAPR
jgi:Na+(H+)/acetate symporter ActP